MRETSAGGAALAPRPCVDEPPGSIGRTEWTPEQVSPTPPTRPRRTARDEAQSARRTGGRGDEQKGPGWLNASQHLPRRGR